MSRSIHEHLDETVIAALREPILDDARGLPASVYTDPDFFQLEQHELFPKVWVSVAFATDVANPGDAVPLSLNGLPIILVRGADKTIRAFHNVCRHRATILLEEPCQGLRHFNCPYHGWSYALDGKLKATPFWDGTADTNKMPVDRATNSLVPIRCAVWNQVVYINLDGEADSLDDYLAPLAKNLENLDLNSLELGHRLHWEFNANWKLVMENWEVYHHVWVHNGVFDKMSDEVDLNDGEPFTDMIADDNVLMLLANERRPPRDLTGPASELPGLPQRGTAKKLTGGANAVLPNTTLTTGPVAYAPAIYIPLAADRTRVEMAWYFAPGVGTGDRHAAGREAVLDRWLGPTRHLTARQGIRSQDHRCMELQQAARNSPVANDVKFSTTWEANVRYFQDWLVTRLGG